MDAYTLVGLACLAVIVMGDWLVSLFLSKRGAPDADVPSPRRHPAESRPARDGEPFDASEPARHGTRPRECAPSDPEPPPPRVSGDA
ncbi:P-loop NTPase family protein [Burkholderia alba]|uniref:hypothetical protein n=1 Tax=Burkholderia alba TaxID=2683677 RepID=UPI002B056A2D|nr:hypothetical protein [Burkholderia alba]